MRDDQVSILLPALNEEEGLNVLLPQIRDLFPEAEILVVDDGSTDRTAQVAKEQGAVVVSHPYRKGNGAAVKTAIRSATRPYLVLMDADGQHRPEEISSLL
ncbi:MAG: glycosyltransferase family 2 protein, partial [Candidatus Omnitrophica bacterium]|nr:glycosyltransferase family 2 protein [Candidatus Omnitrophota bacterium]